MATNRSIAASYWLIHSEDFLPSPCGRWAAHRAILAGTDEYASESGGTLPRESASRSTTGTASAVDSVQILRSAAQKLLIMAAVISVVFAIWTSSSGPHSVDTTLGPPLVAPPADIQRAEVPANQPPDANQKKPAANR